MNRTMTFGAALLCAALSPLQAQLTWEKTQIDLHPKVGQDEVVAHFKYENKTDKVINIKNVRSSCGCTVASLKKNDVAPGESGEVTATFKIGNRTGVQQKAVTVETDAEKDAVTNLTLKAVIPEVLQVQPAFVFWEGGEEPKPKKINVKAGPDVKVTKLDVTSSSPEFETTVEKGKKAGEFVINVTPRDTKAMRSTVLTIKPDLPQTFQAHARVTGPPSAGR